MSCNKVNLIKIRLQVNTKIAKEISVSLELSRLNSLLNIGRLEGKISKINNIISLKRHFLVIANSNVILPAEGVF